jgi:hypothetical protein
MQMHVAHESPGCERGQPDDGRLIAESWRVVHVHWSGVWGACSVVTVSSWAGVSA